MLRTVGGLAFAAGFGALLLATLGMDGSLQYPLFYPQVLIAAIALLFAVSALRDRREARTQQAAHPEAVTAAAGPGGVGAMLASALLCITYAAAWSVIGFFPSTFLYVAAQLWLLRQRGAVLLISVPLCVVALVYVVFAWLLALPFPGGMWSD